MERVADFIFPGSKITPDSDCSYEIKTLAPWKESYDRPLVAVMSDSATPWTIARQPPLSMGFPRSECWSGLPFRQCIKKQRDHFADKVPYSQSYGFSSSHVSMWELNHKEGWVQKNWCFWTVVLKKTFESPFDCKKIKAVNPTGNQPWIFTGMTDAEAPIL